MFRYTTNTLYDRIITGSVSDEVVTEVSSVSCYITMNLTVWKPQRLLCPQYGGSFTNSPDVYSKGAISHFKDELDWEWDGFLNLYSKCRATVLKQDTASKCDIETNRCTYVEGCYTQPITPLFGHTCGVAILRVVHYQGQIFRRITTLWSAGPVTSTHPSLDGELLHIEMPGELPRRERRRIL